MQVFSNCSFLILTRIMDLKFSSAGGDDDDDFDDHFDEEDRGDFGILKSFQVLVLKFETLLDWR